ncbi:ovarian cancer G-protein coupled receptor 1-like [Poecilia latipinna]|uniref:ovarian cancer G-protein coupled receptor 1-like n=1 Tax=Poecilia latipinna TaxID=48699 RepID=UPI00072E5EA9|nr:PREDICTED: ovarian cancer G-protein coupled receptor 1-like [Poecilia latipinna]
MNSTLMQSSCSSNSSVEQHMYPTVYSLFFIVGFPANCLSLFVAWKLALQGNSMAVYLVSLCVSDLLYTVTLPVWIGMAQRWNISDQLCGVMYLIMYNSFYVGSGLLCCISVDRYLAVVYPLHFHWVREVRAAALLSAAVWLLEIFLHILLLHHMGALQSFNLCHQPMPLTQKDADVALVRVVLGFLFPLVVMTLCFQQIMQSLRRSRSILEEERRKVGLLLLLLLITYVASFVPYQMVMFLRVVLEPGACGWARRLRDPYLVTVAMTTLNSTLDPIIYCLINESAKREIGRVMNRGRRSFIKTATRIQAVS